MYIFDEMLLNEVGSYHAIVSNFLWFIFIFSYFLTLRIILFGILVKGYWYSSNNFYDFYKLASVGLKV